MNNEDYNQIVGLRVKAIRNIYNEGIRLTNEQFAHILNISKEKLINYESGRSALPINILNKLYERGANPTYVLAGEGDIFADNEMGKRIKLKILERGIDYIENAEFITHEKIKFGTDEDIMKVAAVSIISV